MDNSLHQQGKRRRRRRRRCTTTSLISCAFILIATIQQNAAATPALPAAAMTTIKENEAEYANPAKYDEATQNYYRTRSSDTSNERGATAATTLPTYANYFGVIDPKTGAEESLITNHNLEEFRDATSTTQIESEDGFVPTTLTAAGQHFAAAASNVAQNGYPLLLDSESFKLPAGSKIDYEINAGIYDDDSYTNRALNKRYEPVTSGENMYQHILQQQQSEQNLLGRQQQQSMQLQERSEAMFIPNTFESQQHQAADVAAEMPDYYNAYSLDTRNTEEFPKFGSHFLSDYQMAQFSNYQEQQRQQQKLQAQLVGYGNELLMTTPATSLNLKTKANHAVTANINQQQQQQKQQQTEQQKLVNYTNQQQKRQYSTSTKQQQPTAEPSHLELQITDSTGRLISLPSSHSRQVSIGDDIDTNDIDSINTNHDNNIVSANNDLTPFEYQHYHQQQQKVENENQQQIDNNLHSMLQQLQQQRQQFAELQLQLKQHEQMLQHQEHKQQKPNLLPSTYEQQTPHTVAQEQLPPVTSTVHHSAASAAAVAGIPLGKHVHITKYVPNLTHYQQQHVPYKQNVTIEIPRPVINTVRRPYPIRIPLTKTVAVPQFKEVKIPIEKITPFPVERSVPYLVERHVPYRVEKQIAKPYYYPYPIKVPVVKTIVHRIPHFFHRHHGGFVGHKNPRW